MPIQIYINGKSELVNEKFNLLDFLSKREIRPEVVSVELNGQLLKRENFKDAIVQDNDQVEIIFHLSGGQRFTDVAELIGNTPLIQVNSEGAKMAEIWAKLESYNPGGSVKDRIALSMIDDAEKKGLLKSGGTIVEPTSGNTGIGLALIASARGYRLILTMPESMSKERIGILETFGAEVILTPAAEGMNGAVKEAEKVAKQHNAYIPQQFDNPANPEIHRKTTAEEIWNDTEGQIDAFVAGVGTGGTITGVGEILKSRNDSIYIVAVEPDKSPVLSGGKPGSHRIQGIGAGFIPSVLNMDLVDEVVKVKDEEAYNTKMELAKKEGLLVGISSGAACFAARIIAKKLGLGKRVVTIFPDTGERYLSLAPYFRY